IIYFSFYFFFSSRRRHTRFKCDWSSDVCSSDLIYFDPKRALRYTDEAMHIASASGDHVHAKLHRAINLLVIDHYQESLTLFEERSEERRVGKECRSRWLTLNLRKE